MPRWQLLLTRWYRSGELGPGSASVQSFPVLLLERKFLRDPSSKIVVPGQQAFPEPEAAARRSLGHDGVQAAIKAGDRLSDAELEDLLPTRGIERSQLPPRTPHHHSYSGGGFGTSFPSALAGPGS